MNLTSDINLPISNLKLKKLIEEYSFLSITEKIHINTETDIFKKFNESKVISICTYSNGCDTYFFVGFEQIVLNVQQSSILFLEELFLSKDELLICFYNEAKSIFDENINIKYKETELDFKKEILAEHVTIKKETKKFVYYLICIMQYLIEKSYIKLAQKDRYVDFDENKIIPKIYNKNDYIDLHIIKPGSTFRVRLIYSIEDKDLLIIKEPLCDEYSKIEYLIKREITNYQKLNHPLLPKFYGTTNTNLIVIEYLNGKPLNDVCNSLNEKEKIIILLQIMMLISYFHDQKMILRDLKPNNIMIDQNKNCVFIDFDRAFNADENVSRDLTSFFVAPDLGNETFSYECDIYSLGKIIHYLMLENNENCEHLVFVKQIYELCIVENPQERPNIKYLIDYFCMKYQSLLFNNWSKTLNKMYKKQNLNLQINEDLTTDEIVYIGNLYFLGKEVPYDINRAIFYYTLAANQNSTYAQWTLGSLYDEGKYVPRDIEKAIKYYSLAINHPKAQYKLGRIYYSTLDNMFDFNKALHCFLLSANQNHPEAQFMLGCIYFEGKHVTQDINKAIHFFILAANQHHIQSQANLGDIFYFNIYCPKDINKAINYLTLAAEQNHQGAHILLAQIYLFDQVVKQDIFKAIHYLSLAANQNNSDAQYKLGVLYCEGKYVYKDINKAIKYYTLSANQNNQNAQYNLGKIYYEGDGCAKDINKAIHYISLAAKQNHPKALFLFGEKLFNGEFIKQKDILNAIICLKNAASQNYAKA